MAHTAGTTQGIGGDRVFQISIETLWLVIGFAGQALFAGRFLVQWIASERAQQSVVPTAFWFLSFGGGVILLAYAIYKADPVFIVGQGAGLAIYLRNLYFVLYKKQGPSCP